MTNHENNTINTDFSVQALILFLKNASAEKNINAGTASGKRTAINILLIDSGILSDSELHDLNNLDVEVAFNRFDERYPNRYPKRTLESYQSHVRSSIRLFFKHHKDSLKHSLNSHNQLNHGDAMPKVTHARSETNQTQDVKVSTFDVQILIRNKEHTITVLNIPKDIRDKDIKKISELLSIYSDE